MTPENKDYLSSTMVDATDGIVSTSVDLLVSFSPLLYLLGGLILGFYAMGAIMSLIEKGVNRYYPPKY